MQDLIDAIRSCPLTYIAYRFEYESYLDLFLNYFNDYKRISSSSDILDKEKIILDFHESMKTIFASVPYVTTKKYTESLPRDRNIIALDPITTHLGSFKYVVDQSLGMVSDLIIIFDKNIEVIKDRKSNLRKEFEYSEIKSIIRNDKINNLLKNS